YVHVELQVLGDELGIDAVPVHPERLAVDTDDMLAPAVDGIVDQRARCEERDDPLRRRIEFDPLVAVIEEGKRRLAVRQVSRHQGDHARCQEEPRTFFEGCHDVRPRDDDPPQPAASVSANLYANATYSQVKLPERHRRAWTNVERPAGAGLSH